MTNEEAKPKIFDDLLNELTPTNSQRIRVANQIFENSNFKSLEQDSLTNYNKNMKNNSNLKYFGLFGGLAFAAFLIVPLTVYFVGLNGTDYKLSESIIAEDSMTTSNFERVDYPDDGDYGYIDEVGGDLGNDMKLLPQRMIELPMGITTKEDTETPMDQRAQIRDASISLVVENFQSSYEMISNKVSSVGGYFVTIDTNSSEYNNYSSMQVRLPVDQFDGFLSFLRSSGEVTSESINIVDKQNEITQYLSQIQLNQSRIDELTSKVNLTQIEKDELDRLKRDVENTQEKLDGVKQKTDFATVWVYLNSSSIIEDDDWSAGGTWEQVVEAIKFVFQFWVSAGMWLLVPLTCLLPIALVILLVRFVRSKKK
jgi:hypothetical protein